MYVSVNHKNVITAVSERFFEIGGQVTKELHDIPKEEWNGLIGKKFNNEKKPIDQMRVAIVCNWNDACGISTYTSFLVNAIKKQVKEVRIYSETTRQQTAPDDETVVRCWKRGESMYPAIKQLLEWKPDFVIVQHEFGIFPKATYFLQMLQMLDDIPYVVCTHSVYEHLDKIVCTSAIKNIVVHSEQGKEVYRKLGHNNNIFVIPHGCIEFTDAEPLWNIFQTPYALMQFGFGFFYKGVDRALDAIHWLKEHDAKYKEIFYVYLCSDSGHFNNVHSEYYNFLLDKIDKLKLHDNVAIIRKFHTEEAINSYLRTAKIALFPYVVNPKHKVYGASGAIRVAMANKIPVIASDSSQFDDLDGVVPRPATHIEMAKEIDEIFSNENYRNAVLKRVEKYIHNNTWDISAERYLKLYYEL